MKLTILQIREAQTSQDNNLGAYGFHYEALITAALSRAVKIQNSKLSIDTVYEFLCHIAIFMFKNKRKYLSEHEFYERLDLYHKEFGIRLHFSETKDVLEIARLLTGDIDRQYRFNYRYVYCYFVARYFKSVLYINNSTTDPRKDISHLILNLHIEDYANILIFLIYLTKDESTINEVLSFSKNQLSSHKPSNMDSDIEFLKELSGKNDGILKIDVSDLQKNNETYREELDKASDLGIASFETDEEIQFDKDVTEFLLFNRSIKILHVMGQILRNFPGSLRRDIKREITTECYLIGLRSLNYMLSNIESNIDESRQFLAQIIQNVRKIENRNVVEEQADRMLYDLCFGFSYWIIKRISNAVGTEDLEETFKEIQIEEAPMAQKLIDLSIKLDHFRSIPQIEIDSVFDALTKKIYRPANNERKHSSSSKLDFKSNQAFDVTNSFAYGIFRHLICNYFYLYTADRSKRQSICSKLGINTNESNILGTWDKQIPPKNTNY